jgi:hypothetical protein
MLLLLDGHTGGKKINLTFNRPFGEVLDASP